MSSEALAGLHQAMNTLDQLETSITKQAARLAFELTNASELVKDQQQKQILDALGESIRDAYDLFWDAYDYADTLTKFLDYSVEHPEEREALEKQGLKLDKQAIEDAIIDFSVQIDKATSKINLYIDTYKNMLGGEIVKDINNYVATLYKFRGALLIFGGEVNKVLFGL
ncbi:MAG: hypothetical protein QW046_05905 [Candidatus Micrarchaeaceae archaeon]